MGQLRSILVVEDDTDCRQSLRELFESRGMAVVEAADGRAALEYLLTQSSPLPGIILTDLALPALSGWELVGIVRSYYRLATIPIVIVSAYTYPTTSHAQPEAYVAKPFDPEKLADLVDELANARAPS
jgi:CheY-like chemotaxis protein